MAQIESVRNSNSDSSERIRELENQLASLQTKYQELQDTVSGFESIASDAISQIDSIFPELEETNKK